MVKAIIFDWGGVLIDNPSLGLKKYCANILGVSINKYDTACQEGFDDFAKGNISEDEFWQIACKKLNVEMPKIESLWGDAVKEVFNEKIEMFELMKRLRKDGYKIGFLSNTEMPAVEYWKNNNYEKYFDEAVFSCVEHMAKPDREIYEFICARLDVLPTEAIFIDDKTEFVKGAVDTGMKGIVFDNYNQFDIELKNILYKQ